MPRLTETFDTRSNRSHWVAGLFVERVVRSNVSDRIMIHSENVDVYALHVDPNSGSVGIS